MMCGFSTLVTRIFHSKPSVCADFERFDDPIYAVLNPEFRSKMYVLACSRSIVVLYEIRISVLGKFARRSTAFASVTPQ